MPNAMADVYVICRAVLVLFLLSVSWVGLESAQADIKSINEAINKASRQRMLSQRMVKAYALIVLEVDPKDYKQELDAAAKLFEMQLSELNAYASGDAIRGDLREVKRHWDEVKAIVSAPARKEEVEKLRDEAEQFLLASHAVVLDLQDMATTASGRLVNIAGRQRMLSERMANLYMIKALGIHHARYKSDLHQAINEFRGAHTELLQSDVNTSEIGQELRSVGAYFTTFEHTVKNHNEQVPRIIAKSSEKILTKMNDVTGMYEVITHAARR